VNLAGNQMAAASKWSGNVSGDWRMFEFGDASINLHLDMYFQTKEYFSIQNDPLTADPGHKVVNGQLSYETPRWSVTGWVANVFNEHYIVASENLLSLGWIQDIRGEPRTFGIRGRLKF
jgi:outer membrane receptor protein involved in Fe transport